MSEYKVGDVVDHRAVREMPVGTVLIATSELVVGSGDWAGSVVITRTDAEDKPWSWWRVSRTCVINYEGIHVGLWRIVHLPEVVAPKVGDIIDTAEKAKLLPVGSVVVDDAEEEYVTSAPMIKVDERWMCWSMTCRESLVMSDFEFDETPHRVIHIPASADAGTGSAAA